MLKLTITKTNSNVAKSGNKKQISFNLIKDFLSPIMLECDLLKWIFIKGIIIDPFKNTCFQVPKWECRSVSLKSCRRKEIIEIIMVPYTTQIKYSLGRNVSILFTCTSLSWLSQFIDLVFPKANVLLDLSTSM